MGSTLSAEVLELIDNRLEYQVSVVQYSTVQYSTVQYSTVQVSAAGIDFTIRYCETSDEFHRPQRFTTYIIISGRLMGAPDRLRARCCPDFWTLILKTYLSETLYVLCLINTTNPSWYCG